MQKEKGSGIKAEGRKKGEDRNWTKEEGVKGRKGGQGKDSGGRRSKLKEGGRRARRKHKEREKEGGREEEEGLGA